MDQGKQTKRQEATAAVAKAKKRAARQASPPRPAAAPPSRAVAGRRAKLKLDELAWSDWLKKVEKAGAGQKLALARRAIDRSPVMDGENAFELLSQVRDGLQEAGRQAELVALLDRLLDKHPSAYREEASWMELWRFESSADLPDEPLFEAARRYGPMLRGTIDLASPIADRLAYQGRMAVVAALADAAWPSLEESDEVFDSVIDEWASLGVCSHIALHLERNPALSADDPALLASLAPYARYLPRGAIADELELQRGPGSLPLDPASLDRLGAEDAAHDGPMAPAAAVRGLVAECGRRLRAERGWSAARALLLRRELGRLVHQQAADAYERDPSAPAASKLLPGGRSFVDAALKQSTTTAASSPFIFSAIVQALPVWAALLVDRGLCSREDARAAVEREMKRARALLPELPRDESPCSVGRELEAFLASPQASYG